MSLSLRLQHETLNRRRGGGGDDTAAPLLFGGICLQKQKATFKPVVYVPVMPEGEKIWGASSNRGFPKIIFTRLNIKIGVVQKAYVRSSCLFA